MNTPSCSLFQKLGYIKTLGVMGHLNVHVACGTNLLGQELSLVNGLHTGLSGPG